MAIEGGSGYRNNLIALAKLRANSKADPMAWSRVFVDNKGGGLEEQSKLLMRTINRMDKKKRLYTNDKTDAIDSYFNMLDRAYGIEEVDPNTKKKIFKPGIGTALEGLMSPVAGERKIDLSSARGLEGLRSNIPNERTGRQGAAKREQRQGNDIIRTLGTASWSKRSEGSTPVGDIIKAVGPELKRDPQAVAQDMTMGILGSFSNIASDLAGADKNLLAEALKKRPELLALVSPLLADGNVRGRTMALEQAGVLRPDAKPLDYLDAASWFLPGVGFAKPTQVATKVAMRAPKTVGAAGAGAGALAYTAMQPEEAKAWNPKVLFNVAKTDKNILSRSWDDLPQELRTSLSEAAYKQNNSTWKRIRGFVGQDAKKQDWMQDGRGISGQDMWEEARNFFKASEFTDESGTFTGEGLNLAELAIPGGRSRSLQWSHIKPLAETSNAEPYIAQGPGTAIFTWPRVNRSMGRQDMLTWLKRPDIDKETKLQIMAQLGERFS